MTIEEIKEKKRDGDIKSAADILKISTSNAWNALHRPGSKYHDLVINIMEKLITSRDEIANEYSK